MQRAVLEGTLLRFVIDVDETEAGRIAFAPLKVVHDAPVLIAQDGSALIGGALEVGEEFVQERNALGIVASAVIRNPPILSYGYRGICVLEASRG